MRENFFHQRRAYFKVFHHEDTQKYQKKNIHTVEKFHSYCHFTHKKNTRIGKRKENTSERKRDDEKNKAKRL